MGHLSYLADSHRDRGRNRKSDMTDRVNSPHQLPVHGRRLTCFRPRQRFSLSRKCLESTCGATCECEHQTLQCWLVREETIIEKNTRRRIWTGRYMSYDWDNHPQICQKWRENQEKYMLRGRTSSCVNNTSEEIGSPSKVSSTLVNAWSSLTNAAEGMLLTGKFDALLRSGVPPHFRGRVWWICSGAAQKRDSSATISSYPSLLKRIPMLSKRSAMEIEKDLPRTFPNDPNCEPTSTRTRTIDELRRILQAYCVRNPVVGYCQSMNFLGAVLLQYMEEEEAFWVLVAMLEDLIPQFHTKTMLGSQVEQRVFSELVQQKLPTLCSHLQYLGVDYEPFTLKWFLCLFLNTLPLETVFRIWDVFFCEGSHILLRVGLTLLKLNQPKILACDDPIDVYEMFKFTHNDLLEITAPHRLGMLNRDDCVCDTLVRLAMDKSFVGPICFDTLYELRQFYRNVVASEMTDAGQLTCQGALISSVLDEAKEQEEILFSERGHQRHLEAEKELAEYDFVEEYSYHCGDISPTKNIHFSDSSSNTMGLENVDMFVDVNYDNTVGSHQT